MTKIAFIGAGSLGFTRELVRDILTFPLLADAELALMDINAARRLDGLLELRLDLICQRDDHRSDYPQPVVPLRCAFCYAESPHPYPLSLREKGWE
jgi:hypothetical protein